MLQINFFILIGQLDVSVCFIWLERRSGETGEVDENSLIDNRKCMFFISQFLFTILEKQFCVNCAVLFAYKHTY